MKQNNEECEYFSTIYRFVENPCIESIKIKKSHQVR